MSKHLISLLSRASQVRAHLRNELARADPSAIKLVRLQRLNLLLGERLRAALRARMVARASAPRLVPVPVRSRALA